MEDRGIDLKIMYGDSGEVDLRTIPFNYKATQVFFQLTDEGSEELVIAGPPSDVKHEDIVALFEYLLETVKDGTLKKALEDR